MLVGAREQSSFRIQVVLGLLVGSLNQAGDIKMGPSSGKGMQGSEDR